MTINPGSKLVTTLFHAWDKANINFVVLRNYKELPDFFDLVANFDGSPKDIQRFDKYFISRADKDFWKTYDWFQKHFNQADPLEAGLYDLNRYYRKVW